MILNEILQFNKDNYFNGAVQADWFYDITKRDAVAKSYVFHGPKYYGADNNDRRLMDTASYVKNICDKIVDKDDESMSITISGYGTGKSHLAVTLASLLSGDTVKLRSMVINRIIDVDKDIGNIILNEDLGKNIVIVLNGMNNFNLDYEVLRCAQKSLELHGYDKTIFKDLIQSYEIAAHFVEQTYDVLHDKYSNAALSKYDKQYIIENIARDDIFESVNGIYKEINGSYIQWERGISAGDVLSFLSTRLCGDRKPFNKVVLLFDEFGRYMEYAASHPTIAGESAFQQIFESVQNMNGKIIFDAFIQDGLEVYLTKIEKSTNMIRYVGRYKNCEKLYISANFETILANLIQVKDHEAFSRIIVNSLFGKYKEYHMRIHHDLMRWIRTANDVYIWQNEQTYNNVIVTGCYPLHPFTVWIFASLSTRLQQRSSMTFAEEMFEKVSKNEVTVGELKYIYPADIMDTGVYFELIDSEERSSNDSGQNILLYREILSKLGDRLNYYQKRVLQAIALMGLIRAEFYDKLDAQNGIYYFTGMSTKRIAAILKELEDNYGVCTFDSDINRFVLVAEANGKNEFNRAFLTKRILYRTPVNIGECNEAECSILELDRDIQTSFAVVNNISSREWRYIKKIVDIRRFNSNYIEGLKRELQDAYIANNARGILLYLYVDKDSNDLIDIVASLYNTTQLEKECIVINVLRDSDNEIIDNLKELRILNTFSPIEKEKFSKFINAMVSAKKAKLSKAIFKLSNERYIITALGLQKSDKAIKTVCNDVFVKIYTKTVPFPFDGFEKKIDAKVKRYFSTIGRALLDGSIENKQIYYALDSPYKTRISSLLSVNSRNSWGVFSESVCCLQPPMNIIVKEIIDEVYASLSTESSKSIMELFKKYRYSPYGMNEYSIAMLVFVFISFNRRRLQLFEGNSKIAINTFINSIIVEKSAINIKFAKLYTIKLQLLEAENDSVYDFVHKVNSVLHTEDCESLLVKLDELENFITDSKERGALQSAKAILQDGVSLNRKTYKAISDAKELMQKDKGAFNLSRAAHVCKLVSNRRGSIEKHKQFVYSDSYTAECDLILAELKQKIDNLGYEYIDNLYCPITSLSQLNGNLKNTSAIFQQYGFVEFSQYITNNVDKINERIKIKNLYEQEFNDIKQFCNQCRNCSQWSWRKLHQRLAKCNEYSAYLKDIKDIDKTTTGKYSDILSSSEKLILTRIGEIKEQIAKVFLDIENADTINKVRILSSDIAELMKLDLETDISLKLQSVAELIKRFINLIGIRIDTREGVNALEVELNNTYTATFLRKASIEHYNNCLTILDKLETKWMDRYVDNMVSEISTMSASECQLWQSDTKVLPDYISHDSKIRFLEISDRVDARIKSCHVDGAIAMYNSLTDKEKEEFLSRIKE